MDISSNKSPIEKRIIKDFEGVQDADQGTLKAIVNFSFYLLVGNMDDAFKVNKERMYLTQFLVAPRSKNKGRLGTSGKNLCKNQKVRRCDTLFEQYGQRPCDQSSSRSCKRARTRSQVCYSCIVPRYKIKNASL